MALWVEAPFLPTPIKWYWGGEPAMLMRKALRQGFPINTTAQHAQIYSQSASPPEGFKQKPGSQHEPASLSFRGNLVVALRIPYCPVPKGHIASDSWGGHAGGLEHPSGFSLMILQLLSS